MPRTSPSKPVRTIVAATDFSSHAARVVKRAAVLAELTEARLELLHVVDASPLARAKELLGAAGELRAAYKQSVARMLDHAITTMPRGVSARTQPRVAGGDVLEEILRAASSHDLLVLGARGANPLRDLILGSTAERVIQKGKGRMLVVKQAAKRPYRRVIVGFDHSSHSIAALHSALSLAPDAGVTLVHAYEAEFERFLWRGMVPKAQLDRLAAEGRRDALAAMHRVATRLGEHAARIDRIVVRGYPPRAILDAATRRHADLIAIGKHGRSAIEQLLIGSRARHVLADSSCDVLVVR